MKRVSKPIFFIFSGFITLGLFSCGNSNDDFDATGSFEATEIIVSSLTNGRILTFDVNEGETLQLGDLAGVIDTTQLFLQKMSLLSNAKSMRVQQPDIDKQTAAVKEQIKTLEREKERVLRLIKDNAANRKQLDDIESQMEVLQSQLTAQTSMLEKSSAHISAQSSALDIQIAQLNDQLEKARITAPVSGTVLDKYAEAGELATIGSPLFKIADLNTMYLRAYVTNDQLALISLNKEVTVKVDDGKGDMRPYQGRISWISSQSEFTPKTIQTKNERANLVYALKIAVQNDGLLKIGMYGEVIL